MHARARLGSQWTARRKPCVQGPLRRAHPASGATFNVQVVRGKVTSKCLWYACRALSLGLLLMVLGAAMATIGYYADQLSVGQEIRGNATVKVKNESRGFHLNNLSYAGPIVMGVGGFIVVAACVMTFEARDSAAKVMPARLKVSSGAVRQAAAAARRCASSQTNRWEHQLGVYKSSPTPSDRRALTAAFMQFSRNLGSIERGSRQCSLSQRPLLPAGSLSPSGPKKNLVRCGSVPNMNSDLKKVVPNLVPTQTKIAPRRPPKIGCTLLNPAMLPRQALSVDESHVRCARRSRESLAGSQGSMAMDLHVPNDGPVTLRIRDKSRPCSKVGRPSRPPAFRSDTARRHMLARQKQIDDEENHAHSGEKIRDTHSCSPHLPGCHISFQHDNFGCSDHHKRRDSNASDSLYTRRKEIRRHMAPRRSASTSPQPRRYHHRPDLPSSLDLGQSSDANNCSNISPDLCTSEYHTVCEDQQSKKIKSFKHPNSVESRDSRVSTETATLHTTEINISDDAFTASDFPAEVGSSLADNDLTDTTPTLNDDELGSSMNEDNDPSTVIDMPQDEN